MPEIAISLSLSHVLILDSWFSLSHVLILDSWFSLSHVLILDSWFSPSHVLILDSWFSLSCSHTCFLVLSLSDKAYRISHSRLDLNTTPFFSHQPFRKPLLIGTKKEDLSSLFTTWHCFQHKKAAMSSTSKTRIFFTALSLSG